MVPITVVYDNRQYNPNTKAGWGFSCIVWGNKTVMFDTGGDSTTLLLNMKAMGISPQKIEVLALSHAHGDHTGGLAGFLEENNKVKVYFPSSFSRSFKAGIEAKGAEAIEVTGYTKITDGVYTTGELGTSTKEQSLLVETSRGVTVITGCAHPGIAHIVEKAGELTGKKIHLVMGGFHLSGASDDEVKKIISEFKGFGVKKVAPCHCTGSRAIRLFEEEYGNGFVKVGTGKIIKV